MKSMKTRTAAEIAYNSEVNFLVSRGVSVQTAVESHAADKAYRVGDLMDAGWMPVCYDVYDEEEGVWSYKFCTPSNATHVLKTRATRKPRVYKWNQRKACADFDRKMAGE